MRTLSSPIDDPVKASQLLRKHLSDEQQAVLIKRTGGVRGIEDQRGRDEYAVTVKGVY